MTADRGRRRRCGLLMVPVRSRYYRGRLAGRTAGTTPSELWRTVGRSAVHRGGHEPGADRGAQRRWVSSVPCSPNSSAVQCWSRAVLSGVVGMKAALGVGAEAAAHGAGQKR